VWPGRLKDRAIFGQAEQYVRKLRTNLNVGNVPLQGLPGNVSFRDRLKRPITDSEIVAQAPLKSPLKELRKQRKVRQRDVANLADVSQGHLSEVETGIAMPCDRLSRLLQAMNLLEAQREFIRVTQRRTKRKSHHQLIGPGGDADGLRNIGTEGQSSHQAG